MGGPPGHLQDLLNEGLDPNWADEGLTLLMYCAQEGRLDNMRVLIGAAADVNAVEENRSVLSHAMGVSSGTFREDAVQLLLDHGALLDHMSARAYASRHTDRTNFPMLEQLFASAPDGWKECLLEAALDGSSLNLVRHLMADNLAAVSSLHLFKLAKLSAATVDDIRCALESSGHDINDAGPRGSEYEQFTFMEIVCSRFDRPRREATDHLHFVVERGARVWAEPGSDLPSAPLVFYIVRHGKYDLWPLVLKLWSTAGDAYARSPAGSALLTEAVKKEFWGAALQLLTSGAVVPALVGDVPLLFFVITKAKATESESFEFARRVIDGRAEVDIRSRGLGWTLLHVVASRAEVELATLLLDAGCAAVLEEPDASGCGVLDMALFPRDVTTKRVINTDNFAHASEARSDMVQLLLERRASANARSDAPIRSAVTSQMCHPSFSEDVLQDDHARRLRLLVDAGAYPTAGLRYLLTEKYFVTPPVNRTHQCAALKRMLHVGGDIDEVVAEGRSAFTLLFAQIDSKQTSIFPCLDLLIKARADVAKRGAAGITPLMYMAQRRCDVAAVTWMLEARTDPNVQDDFGETVLHHLVRHESYTSTVWDILIEAGADPQLRNKEGQLPTEVSRDWDGMPDLFGE